MTREEAIQILSTRDAHGVLCGYTSGVTEALDMAISALQAEPKITKVRKDGTLFVTVLDVEKVKKVFVNDLQGFCNTFCEEPKQNDDSDYDSLVPDEYKTEPSDLISRADAIEAVANGYCSCVSDCVDEIKKLSSSGTDCTDFIDWIRKVVADEELWELNAAGYGEIICRKLVKIGALATTEKPPYYYVPSADAVPQLKQTDTLIIANALRYLAQDTERHLSDRTRADALREQILQYGASMCHSADAVQGWIPCSERLPSMRTEVIYSFDGIVSTGYMTDRDFNGEKMELHWEDLESGATIEPIAWMPLPKPYREDGE